MNGKFDSNQECLKFYLSKSNVQKSEISIETIIPCLLD